ncbi:hypothetical protein Hanom_Chr12g01080231 [Helianthus anomalus]
MFPATLWKNSCNLLSFIAAGKNGLSFEENSTVALHLCTVACPIITCFFK